jgi:CheY-like chemotaxis protein
MPKKDGYQASKEIIQLYQNAGIAQPFICAITGHTEEAYLMKAKKSGINMVICKPALEKDIKSLLNIVNLNK